MLRLAESDCVVPLARRPLGPARPVPVAVARLPLSGAPIEAKLHGPAARPEWVARHELVGYLAGVTTELVLVDAPAGFGKTTLIAQWHSEPGREPSVRVDLA